MTETPARPVMRDAGDERRPSLGEIGLQRFAPYLMNRIMGRYNSSLRDSLAAMDLTTSKARALAVLATRNGLTATELAVYCVIEQSTMSRTLAAMTDDGLVRREEDGQDSRARRIFLTETGRRLFDEVWPEMSRANDGLFVGIDEDERERFVATLQQLLANTRQHPV